MALFAAIGALIAAWPVATLVLLAISTFMMYTFLLLRPVSPYTCLMPFVGR